MDELCEFHPKSGLVNFSPKLDLCFCKFNCLTCFRCLVNFISEPTFESGEFNQFIAWLWVWWIPPLKLILVWRIPSIYCQILGLVNSIQILLDFEFGESHPRNIFSTWWIPSLILNISLADSISVPGFELDEFYLWTWFCDWWISSLKLLLSLANSIHKLLDLECGESYPWTIVDFGEFHLWTLTYFGQFHLFTSCDWWI